MKRVCKRLLSLLLVVSLMLSVTPTVFAVDDELYLCELRLVYAEDYDTARAILDDGEFEDYELLDENLNPDTGEIGVWLAYKTTDNIDDAITDLAVMQMQGGYQEGNYQEMIKKSYDEYVQLCDIYVDAVDYFVEAYDADHFLAVAAYRQLNLYTAITDPSLGIKIPSFDGEKLGDIFYDGIDEIALATMFMEGNSYALDNIRSLLAMGVSYNEDGMTYLEKVAEAAQEMTDDPDVYSDEDYEIVMPIISVTLTGFKDIFEEMAAYEDALDYEDEEYTDLELSYLENYAIATMMRNTEYLDGKTLYEFCMGYDGTSNDYTELCPLAAALNDGQMAMTKVAHYQDVIRYSMPSVGEDEIDAEITELEEKYGEHPFNIYSGVDRSVFTGTFALTNAAYRADAYTETESLTDSLFGEQLDLTIATMAMNVVGLSLIVGGIYHFEAYDVPVRTAAITKEIKFLWNHHSELMGGNTIEIVNSGVTSNPTYDQFLSDCILKYYEGNTMLTDEFLKNAAQMSTYDKYFQLWNEISDEAGDMFFNSDKLSTFSSNVLSPSELAGVNSVADKLQTGANYLGEQGHRLTPAEVGRMASDKVGSGISMTTTFLFIAGGIVMLTSAVIRGISIYNYYHPEYDDIPTSMVDVIDTVDGDRYIKYDVVYEAEENDKKTYSAGDLNAFSAQRWNALYYTKSYEAGQPLLADEFEVSYNNNVPDDGYAPVHRFGEVICYDLNKYHFDDKAPSIYLSVRQSENEKSAVADVPDVVGSIFGNGMLFLAAGIGAIAGIGGTLATLSLGKKKKVKEDDAE